MRTYISKQARTLRRWLLSESRTEIRGYQQLEWLLRDLKVPVAMTNMSVQPSTLLWIINDIRINRRQCIVELGGGASTQMIAACLQRMEAGEERPRFYSVEEDADWIDYLRATLKRDGLDEYVDFIYAPRQLAPSGLNWYDRSVLDTRLDGVAPDLLLVDGPGIFNRKQPDDRYEALAYFQQRMSPSYTVFIDDTVRAAERRLLRDWSKASGVPFETMNAYLGVITRGKHYTSKPF
jgi:hypothetical protein